MHINLDPQPSCARAWAAAASAIAKEGEGYNVILGIDDPTAFDDRDEQMITHVNTFLMKYQHAPITTVVNLIFPQSLYRKHGAKSLYAEYHKVYDKLARKGWGRYFERMTRKRGSDGEPYNPLQDIIDKLRKQNGARTPYKAAYDIALYDPELDRKRYRNSPCLSFLSFKRHADRTLSLTATYRNHSYISRCLGNLIGLGYLQSFVAGQSDLKVGPLTCISAHAEIDKGESKAKENKWGLKKARALIEESKAILAGRPVAV